jgi:hypothetical protein
MEDAGLPRRTQSILLLIAFHLHECADQGVERDEQRDAGSEALV